MSINRTSVVTSPSFVEAGSHLFSVPTSVYSYKPAAGGTNSCISGPGIDLSEYIDTSNDVQLRIRLLLTYSGTFGASGGTFAMRFQGSNYETASSSYKWAGTNYICAALNNQQSLATLVTSSASGSYQYDTTCTIPASWFQTYSRSYLGIRTDYSNGNGTVSFSDIRIEPEKYASSSNGKAHIGSDFISANAIIEV